MSSWHSGANQIQLAWLIGEWPGRFVGLMGLQGVTRRPLVINMSPIPEWYDGVAEQLSQRSGKRPRPVAHVEPHLSLQAMQARLAEAQTDLERRRWTVLCLLMETPDLQVVARQVGMSDQTVRALLRRYNADGPSAMSHGNRGRVVQERRLLTVEQEAELRGWLAQERPSNAELSAWIAERCGRVPDATTLWIYRRGCESHSRVGRRASG